MEGIKIVRYKDIEDQVGMTRAFWESISGLSAEEKKEAIRLEVEAKMNKEFLASLKGKTLEEQMESYRIVEHTSYSKTAYGEITKSNMHDFGYALKDYKGLNALIVEDGVIIGVCIDAFACYNALGKPAFPYQNICTYYASDNNGSGSNDREDYVHLCLVMPE
ncbi:MAG: hypothetical protein IJ043_01590 [Clostridia bacterium]|nr:hypothetical protein [Clostridia bacterium]